MAQSRQDRRRFGAMCDAVSATNLVSAVVDAVDVPVTVKMRLGWDADNLTAPDLARSFEQIGVAAVILHGRTLAPKVLAAW